MKCAVLFHKSSRVGGSDEDGKFGFALVVTMMHSRMKGITMWSEFFCSDYWHVTIYFIVTICDCLYEGDVLDLDMCGEHL